MVSAIYQASCGCSLIYRFSYNGFICVAVSCALSTQQLNTRNYSQVLKQSMVLDRFCVLGMIHMQ